MTSLVDIRMLFENQGGVFLSSPSVIAQKIANIKAFVFDWDGVFNDGRKGGINASDFSEIDSMGVNMLRFSSWLTQNKTLPICAILTGADNKIANEFGVREKFQKVYFKVLDKNKALDHLLADHGFKAHEVAFFFDDILDMGVAQRCGLNVFISSPGKVMLTEFVKNGRADYITRMSGGEHGVREACELLIALGNNYEEVIERRFKFDQSYQSYLKERQGGSTGFYTLSSQGLITEHHVE
ncbi:MAG: hypothetical protein KDC83_04660 [Flavobacteriales bacterium]|nr:hypothetical protein [Flavobacteriales bacterium]